MRTITNIGDRERQLLSQNEELEALLREALAAIKHFNTAKPSYVSGCTCPLCKAGASISNYFGEKHADKT